MSNQAKSFAAHLEAAAPTITSPWHFLAVVYSWLASLAGPMIDTPAERASIENVVMSQYDKLTLSLMATNPALSTVFGVLRPRVKEGIDWILVLLAPAPAPTPTPLSVVIPQGATP